MLPQLRIARPVSDLARAVTRYRDGLGLHLLGGFDDHAGFDGHRVVLHNTRWTQLAVG